MSGSRRAATLGLLAAALGLAGLGQFYFFRRQPYVWDGVVFYGLAVVCFLGAWRQIAPLAARTPVRRAPLAAGVPLAPAGLLAAGALLTLAAILVGGSRTANQPTGDMVSLWLLGMAAAGAAALWPAAGKAPALPDVRRRLAGVSNAAWLEAATVAGLTLLAFLLRATALASVPFTLGGDEAWHGLLARQVLHGELRNPFVMGYMSMPTFFYWPVSWAMRLAGEGMAGLRLPAAVAGTATVPVLYLMVRSLWGRRTALLAAAFLTGYDYHIHYSRLGANNVWDPLFVAVVLWIVDRGLARPGPILARQRGLFILAGLVTGLAFYFYTGARLLPLLILGYAAFVWLRRRRAPGGETATRAVAGALLLVLAGMLIAGGPMIHFALTHPADWNSRINQIGIFQSGWLAREPGLTGKSTIHILAEQFLRSAGAFHVFPDRTVWYGAERPLLGFLAGVFALLGMAWAVARWRERRYFLLLMWFWAVIVTGGMLTESPPSSQRLVIAIPAVCVLVALGLEQTVALASHLLRAPRLAEPLVLGLLVLALAAGNVRYYFSELMPTERYGSENGRTATLIGRYLHDLDGEPEVFFFGAPRMYWSFGTMGFLAPGARALDVVDPLTGPPSLPVGSGKTVFVFLPERAGEMAWVRERYPGGRTLDFPDSYGRVRFSAYELH